MDYYGVTTKKTLEIISKNAKDKKIYLYALNDLDICSLQMNYYYYYEEFKDKIILLASIDEYNKLKEQELDVVLFVNPTYRYLSNLNKKNIYDYKLNGNIMFSLYE